MSGVVVEVRVKEGQEIKKGDPVCGQHLHVSAYSSYSMCLRMSSSECYEGKPSISVLYELC